MIPSGGSAQAIIDRLAAPIVEFRFLLNRSYRRGHALRVVGEHHQLSVRDRNVLERVVFADAEAAARRARRIVAEAVSGQLLVIDGFNVLISLEVLLAGEPLFLADDGVLRDIAARRGLRARDETSEALAVLAQTLCSLSPRRVEIVLDQQVSRSGQLAEACRGALAQTRLEGEAWTATQADRTIIDAATDQAVVCSSDRVILDGTSKSFDLVAQVAKAQGVEVGSAPTD